MLPESAGPVADDGACVRERRELTDPIPPSVWIPAALDRLHRKVCRACGRNVADVEWVCPVCLAPWHVAPWVKGWFDDAAWRRLNSAPTMIVGAA